MASKNENIDLKKIDFKPVYDSEENNIVNEFYMPCLRESVTYKRATGFFSASTLFYLTAGLSSFFLENNGKIQFIISHEISDNDLEIIKKGYENRKIENDLNSIISDWEIPSEANNLFFARISNLSFLIEKGLVDIKIAFRVKGIFHEKVGLFTDEKGNMISFIGSCNETVYGLTQNYNYESLEVNRSWNESELEKIIYHQRKFDLLWENKVKNTYVINFPDAVKTKLLNITQNISTIDEHEESILWDNLVNKYTLEGYNEEPRIPDEINQQKYKLKKHQKDAIDALENNRFKGILEMSTGSGKTITAVHTAVKLYEYFKTNREPKSFFLLIAVPYVNLAEQWLEVLKTFNIFPIKCYDSFASWSSKLINKINRMNMGNIEFGSAVVVNKTLRGQEFQKIIQSIPKHVNFLFIGDEVHNHDSNKTFITLPENAQYKIGLSATIGGCHNIQKYYGESIYKYSIKNAIDDGILTRYYYQPSFVELTMYEMQDYIELSKEIGKLQAIKNNDESYNTDYLNSLYNKRNDLLGNAENKIKVIQKKLEENYKTNSQILMYCSPTIMTNHIMSEEIRQINIITSLMDKLGIRSSRYTSRESKKERIAILDSFKTKKIDALVAIRCLDEGVDIPAVENAFIIASTSNPKQFIQRRGRVLRKYPGKEFSVIYDLIVTFPNTDNNEDIKYGKSLLSNELKRVLDFAQNSMNYEEILKKIETKCNLFNIDIYRECQ